MASTTTNVLAHASFTAKLRPPILDSYILSEFTGPFFAALGAFLLFWGFNIIYVAADYLVNAHAPFFLVFRFALFRVPQAIPMAFPFATLFATLLGIGRLSADNEIIAMRTSGVTLWRICAAPIIFGVVMFLISYAMNEYIAPKSVDISTRTFYQILYHTASLPVEPQFFRRDPDTNTVFYVAQVLGDNKTMQGVQIFKPGRTGYYSETLQAKTATVEGAELLLRDVIDTHYNNNGEVTAQNKTGNITIGLPLAESGAEFMTSVNSDAWTMNTGRLKNQVSTLKAQGIGGSALGSLQLALGNKSAWPFASLIGVLIGLPLAIRFGRRGRAVAIPLAIVVFFMYFVMTSIFSALGKNEAMNPYWASWMPNLLFGGLGLLGLYFENRSA